MSQQHPRTLEEKSSKSLSLAASLVIEREEVRSEPTPKAAQERAAARAVRTRDIALNFNIVGFEVVFLYTSFSVLQCLVHRSAIRSDTIEEELYHEDP